MFIRRSSWRVKNQVMLQTNGGVVPIPKYSEYGVRSPRILQVAVPFAAVVVVKGDG